MSKARWRTSGYGAIRSAVAAARLAEHRELREAQARDAEARRAALRTTCVAPLPKRAMTLAEIMVEPTLSPTRQWARVGLRPARRPR